ncbi:MAG: thiol peroxidase [Negativicoccus succinicivorans]|uniref:thiol peroxidase n=1 Tax=Negativicoccus succinicivorans TaxID=620903 RepID=UPI0023569456|nr:thiol peroxidase [Negativicoccus succinicivorans]MBS5889881.1 thiol peroxidase [Negativicoccus succinicivorans]MDU0986449.1 thiol peroxidase [Negativicoccus succinicivorans]MDU1066155.1 thiol peroxidase [Negativicoccus succinicivorans]MDU2643946.1 thiol peroxidase [Negativicoccus succinicivorans]MDU5233301.1 thiol peroxidase [Negativicoccus succinicivorans]
MEKRTTKWDGQVLALAGKEIKVGDTAPDATLVARDLTAKKLSDWDGQIKVLLAMPSMDTPVCQSQVRQFNKDAVDFADDVVVIALSTDLPFAQERFCAAEGLDRVVTLSDHKTAEFGEKYGYLIPDLRLLSRGVVVVDRDNVVRYIEYVPEANDQVDFAKALEALKKLK